MANRVLALGQQFLTSTGALASGYQLFIYQSGTTTKQAIYPTAADADAATNALTNPIVLNSRGEASTNGTTATSVYVPDATTSIKAVLALGTDTDPPSSPIRTEDAFKLTQSASLGSVASSIVPASDDTYDLGSSSFEWRNLYIDGTANIDSLVADTAAISGGTITGVVFTDTENAQVGTTYTLVASDASKTVTCTNGSAITVTVPASTFSARQVVTIIQYGAGQVTLSAGGGMTLRSRGSQLKTAGQYSVVSLWFKSATEAIVMGDVTT